MKSMETIKGLRSCCGRHCLSVAFPLLLVLTGLSSGSQPPTVRPREAKNGSSGLLIGGGIALGVVLAILAIAIWWYIRMRGRMKERRKPSKQKLIPATTPRITLNKIEFTVPTSNENRQQWGNGDGGESPLIQLQKSSDTYSSASSIDTLDDEHRSIPTSIGFLRPDLYSSDNEQEDSGFPPGHIGRIWFRLEYDCEAEKLFVSVINIVNLPARQHRGSSLSISANSTCDSFVRIFLLPDEKRYLQTKVKKRTRNPNFHQRFAFSMSYSVLIERTLRLSVFDVDRFTRQTAIGHALYSLKDLDITMATEDWRDLEKEGFTQTDSNGEVFLSLTYLPQVKRVALTVSKASGLYLNDFPSLNPYAKINHSVMGKVNKTKKTPVFRDTFDPQFDFCFEFKVNPDLLEQTCFTVEIWHSTSPVLKHDKLIGRVDVGGSLVSRGKGLDHWTGAMLKPNTPIKECHFLHH